MMGAESVALPTGFIGIDRLSVLGLPLGFALFLVLAIKWGLILHRSVFGRWIFAVGGGEDAGRYSAVPVARVKLAAFILSGLFAGLAGVMIDSRLGVARYDHARTWELDVITATVLGGASIYGGKGSVLGSVIALLLVGIVRTEMGLANVATEYQLTVIGGLLIFAVGFRSVLWARGRQSV